MVVTTVTCDGDNSVLTGGQFSEFEILHGSRGTERLLRIVKDVRHGIHAHVVVGEGDTHSLFTHGRLVGVTRRLVVIGERNNGSANTKNHGRVNLAMSPCSNVGVWPALDSSMRVSHWLFVNESSSHLAMLVEVFR